MSDTAAPAHRLVRFGVFELDLRSGELRKSGACLTLQQQPQQLLSVLLEQPGEVVTREEAPQAPLAQRYLRRLRTRTNACGPSGSGRTPKSEQGRPSR